MPDIYSHELFRAIQGLLIAGVAAFAYKLAKDAAERRGRWWSAWRALAWCLGLAAFAAIVMGQPSCTDSGDRMFGICEETADDGYTPSTDQRLARFLFFALVLTVPALLGAVNGRPRRTGRTTDGDAAA